MTRQTRKRRPKKGERPEPPPAEPRPMTDAEHARVLQRFSKMTGRGFEIGYVPLGRLVDAANPDDLREKTGAAIVEATKKLPRN